MKRDTFATAQLLWAETNKVGCASAKLANGNTKVLCNFAPGASFTLHTDYYCGILSEREIDNDTLKHQNWIDTILYANRDDNYRPRQTQSDEQARNESLKYLYKEHWLKLHSQVTTNGTIAGVARLVTRYVLHGRDHTKCDSNKSIYIAGSPGHMCSATGERYKALCYDFREENPGYRLVAVLAPAGIFSLILYDLFSSVMRNF